MSVAAEERWSRCNRNIEVLYEKGLVLAESSIFSSLA
jgi:hypothetical protein